MIHPLTDSDLFMPIQIQCPTCEKAFKVKDAFAGKKIRCPKCKEGVIQVPQAGAGSTAGKTTQQKSASAGAATKSKAADSGAVSDKAAMQSPNTMWHLKTEDGEIYGPITRTELDEWYAEGRVSAECQIIIDGASQWKWANELYPELDQEEAGGSEPSPFDFGGGGGGGGAVTSVATKGAAAETAKTGLSDKSKMIAGLLALFAGNLGIHRFYLGYTGLGIAMICCCGGCGIWSLIDAIMIFTDKVKDSDGRTLKP